MTRGAAFFDLDRTLMRENSGALYARYEYRHGRLGLYDLLKSSWWLLLHHLTLLDVEVAYQRAAEHWRGDLGSEVGELAERWFEQEVAWRLTPGGRRAIDEHQARGQPTVLLSNTSGYIAAAAARCWQLDHWLANIIPLDDDGRINGKIAAPLCYGPGKVIKAEAWAAEHDVSLADSYFYSDSLSDLPMLERVGHARIVNPDPMLRRVAKARNWPVLDWTQSS